MKFDVDAVAPFASVTVTDTVLAPPTVGVPEIVPVEVFKLRPSINVPVRAYVSGARPPVAGTAREKAPSPVLFRPVVGVAMVSAVATVKVKFDVDAVAPFASVTETDTVDEPAIVGVPEIVPVEVFKLRPFTNVPVREYVNVDRPPVAGTEREKALFAVPNNPVEGDAIDIAPTTVNVAEVEVLDEKTPLLKVLVTTTL